MKNIVMDCGDNSCLFAKVKGGMRTNSGCRCQYKHRFPAFALQITQQLAAAENLLALLAETLPERGGRRTIEKYFEKWAKAGREE